MLRSAVSERSAGSGKNRPDRTASVAWNGTSEGNVRENWMFAPTVPVVGGLANFRGLFGFLRQIALGEHERLAQSKTNPRKQETTSHAKRNAALIT